MVSEADRTWRITVSGTEHEIEVDHSTMTGKIVVTLDGEQVGEDRMLATKKEIEFSVDGEQAVVGVSFAFGGMGATSELHVGGRYVEPLVR